MFFYTCVKQDWIIYSESWARMMKRHASILGFSFLELWCHLVVLQLLNSSVVLHTLLVSNDLDVIYLNSVH